MHVITCSKGAILIHNESQLMQEPSSKNQVPRTEIWRQPMIWLII